jgi:hypothetical protein
LCKFPEDGGIRFIRNIDNHIQDHEPPEILCKFPEDGDIRFIQASGLFKTFVIISECMSPLKYSEIFLKMEALS